MNNIILVLAACGALLSMGGCNKTAGEPVQTVEWYKANTAERASTLAKCNSNPGELETAPNCINAKEAESSTTWGATGGVKAPAPLVPGADAR